MSKKHRRDTERRKAAEDSVAREVEEILLEERGEIAGEVIEIAARDRERSPELQEMLDRERSRRGSFYSDLVFSLCNVRYEEHEARLLWVNLLAHKTEMSERLGRNVGIRVAALDYFKNIVGLLDEVRIVGGAEFIETSRLAVTDGLTGLFNHRYFQDRMERGLVRAKELGQPLTLMMIDIDYFKQYNDLNGHIAGDVALREMAAILRRSVKREDVVARYGGEEFAVVLWNTDRSLGAAVAERLRREVEAMDFPNEQVLPAGQLTISIGLAASPEDGDDRTGLIAMADQALYAAKRSGRNRVCARCEDMPGDASVSMVGTPVAWKAPGGSPASGRAVIRELTRQGAVAVAEAMPEAGSAVVIEAAGPFAAGRSSLSGRVVWREDIPGGTCAAGIRFDEPLPARRAGRSIPLSAG